VIHALDEELPCVYYNTWMCHLPQSGSFLTEVGNDQFLDVLAEHYDQDAVEQWKVRGGKRIVYQRCARPAVPTSSRRPGGCWCDVLAVDGSVNANTWAGRWRCA
jgi:hypothetical protein